MTDRVVWTAIGQGGGTVGLVLVALVALAMFAAIWLAIIGRGEERDTKIRVQFAGFRVEYHSKLMTRDDSEGNDVAEKSSDHRMGRE